MSFSHQRELVVFRWSLSDSKSLQVSRGLLSIPADFNNAVVWGISTRPLIIIIIVVVVVAVVVDAAAVIVVVVSALSSFSQQCWSMVSHWSLSDSKSPGFFSVIWLISIMP